MNSRSQRRSGNGWQAIFVVIAIALLGNQLGFFDSLDSKASDMLHRIAPHSVDDTSILLVECKPTVFDCGNPKLETLLNRISQASPSVIGVVSERTPLHLRRAMVASTRCPIVEGRPASKIEESERDRVGFSELNLNAQSVFRHAQLSARSRKGDLHSFEKLLSAKAGYLPRSNGVVGIRFGSSIHSIPRITADRILNGNYIPELIEDRIVIVGEVMPESAGKMTPASTAYRMPLLEVRGHTVLTLLSNAELKKPGLVACLALFTIFTVGSFLAAHRRQHKHLGLVILLVCIAVAGVSYLAFRFLSVCLPVTSLMLLGVAIPACLWNERFRILHEIVSERKLRLKTHALASSNDRFDDEPWQQIADAANQFFGARRMALFELDPASQRIKVIERNDCVGDPSLLERRRDPGRDPWRQAMDLGKPIRNVERPVFSRALNADERHRAEDPETRNGDTEFIVPLLVGSRIFGFMVLEMINSELEKWPDFENIVGKFTSDFAPLIHQHRTLEKQRNGWRGWLLQKEILDYDAIEKSNASIKRSVTQIEKAFDSDSCCRAMVSVYGNVVRANSRLIRRLDSEIPVSDIGFQALLQKIADVTESDARIIFRNAIVSDQRTELPTRSGASHGTIVISPIAWNHNDKSELSSRGLLVEVSDTREDADLKKLEAIVGTASTEIANDMHNLSEGSSLLKEIENLVRTAKTVVTSKKEGTFETVWNSALFNVQPQLQEKNLTLATKFGDAASVKVRDADLVSCTTEVCLSVLAECSRHSDTLKLRLSRNQTHWVLRMRNGQHDFRSNWTSPSIVGKRQAELLFAQRQKMQACGGSVDVQDDANGEVVIHVSFPAGVLKTEACVGLEAARV
jgi:CHASE2 domain-containing sensor protein